MSHRAAVAREHNIPVLQNIPLARAGGQRAAERVHPLGPELVAQVVRPVREVEEREEQ